MCCGTALPLLLRVDEKCKALYKPVRHIDGIRQIEISTEGNKNFEYEKS
jgi:hypothetical protein